jgi:hypothetical protein
MGKAFRVVKNGPAMRQIISQEKRRQIIAALKSTSRIWKTAFGGAARPNHRCAQGQPERFRGRQAKAA